MASFSDRESALLKRINKDDEEFKKKQSLLETLKQQGTVTTAEAPSSTGVPNFTTPVPETKPAASALPNKDIIRERAKDKQVISMIPKEAEQNLDSVFGKLGEMTATLPAEQQQLFKDRLDKLSLARQEAEKKYEDKKNSTEFRSFVSDISNALTQLGAGAYGLKHNIDMSGLKFKEGNWESEYNRAEKELDRKLGLIKEEEQGVLGEQSNVQDRLDSDVKFRKQAILQDFIRKQDFDRQTALQNQKLGAQMAMLEKKLRADAAGPKKISPEEKEKLKALNAQITKNIKDKEDEVKRYDKALALAIAAKETGNDKDLEKAYKALGGETGEKAREAVNKADNPGGLFGLLSQSDAEEAVTVLKGYLTESKNALEEIKQVAVTPSESSAPPPPPKEDMVKVIAPDGSEGMIPAANVEKAKLRGYKVVN